MTWKAIDQKKVAVLCQIMPDALTNQVRDPEQDPGRTLLLG